MKKDVKHNSDWLECAGMGDAGGCDRKEGGCFELLICLGLFFADGP